jgi:hypothetical protein|tara:strand:+ start:62 stop:409 length:348 start_codon:yes stop_codon:yes gene_type:complete
MDERLENALEFANYRITLGNQKRTIRQRMTVLTTVQYKAGVFHANPTTISFVKALVDAGKTKAIVLDTKDNPIEIEDLNEFLDTLLSAYTEATNEYKVQLDKVKKARNIKSLMDW